MIDSIVWALAVSGLFAAQHTGVPDQEPDSPHDSAVAAQSKDTSGPNSPQWRRMSVEEKLRYDGRHLFDIENLVFAAMGAAIDQWRDRPGEWGEGWGPLGERYASHIGQYIIQRSIMFPVQAIDHEDTRYIPSTRTTYKGRLGDALLQTVWRHSDQGGGMPAYSEFLGDYGASAVSRFWWPQRFHNGSAIFIAGSNTIFIDAGINAFHEFTPDIKRWLHLSH